MVGAKGRRAMALDVHLHTLAGDGPAELIRASRPWRKKMKKKKMGGRKGRCMN